MGIPGNKCVRCGHRAAGTGPSSIPICGRCEAELRAERERTRACPIDGTALEKEIISNVVVDHCPGCHGIWLDAGELRLVLEGRRIEQWLDGFAHTLADLV